MYPPFRQQVKILPAFTRTDRRRVVRFRASFGADMFQDRILSASPLLRNGNPVLFDTAKEARWAADAYAQDGLLDV